jgi:hypothetical protein
MPTPRSARSPRPRTFKAPASAAVKRKRIGKRLEKLARQVKDADDFVDHIAGLSHRYRHEHALSAAAGQAALRQSARTFHKHAAALALWLRQAHDGAITAIEREVLDRIGNVLHGSPGAARSQSAPVLEWLTRATRAAEDSAAKPSRRGDEGENPALRIAAEGLRATFEHHKLNLTLSGSGEPANAVLLLCAIAREAGHDSLPAASAKAALRESGRRRAG